MKRAVLDIGNTRIKGAVFNNDGSIAHQSYFTELEAAIHWLQQEQVTSLMTASVAQAIMPSIPGMSTYSLTHESHLPFKNLYSSRETLGVDRIAVMAAAAIDYPDKAVLVFDIGTCMTIDLLHPDGTYKGGNISPGINMRLEAMHQMTKRLPLSSKEESTSLMGDSTRSAIASGVIHGMRFEIEGYINTFKQDYPELITVLCGGDYSYFEMPRKNEIFAAPGFVLQGLYYLLKLNEN